jgi:hypothetical protein
MSDPRRAVHPDEAAMFFKRNFGDFVPTFAEADPEPPEDRKRSAQEGTTATIPLAFRWARFSAPELAHRVKNPEAIALARRSLHDRRIVLSGRTGEGKTSLAIAMMRAWTAEKEKVSLFVPARALGVARLQHQAGHEEPEIVSRSMRSALLVLDDVGAERDTQTNAVADVVSERFDRNLPTWVTTGMTRTELASRYGEGVLRRLFEHATILRVSPKEVKT